MFIITCYLTPSIFLAPKNHYSISQDKTLEEQSLLNYQKNAFEFSDLF